MIKIDLTDVILNILLRQNLVNLGFVFLQARAE